MERSVVRGLAVFRWAAWAWMALVLLLGRHQLRPGRPWLAVLLVAGALAVMALATALLRARPDQLLAPAIVLLELSVGFLLLIGYGIVYEEGHAFSTQQSLGVAWPLFGVLSAGVAFGPIAGAVGGAAMGLGRLAGTLANGIALDQITGGRVASHVTTLLVYALAGAMVGYVVTLLRRAESEVATARAREEVARRLHDGVLQTLAVVERRSGDDALARLAREQERELREWLFAMVAVIAGAGRRFAGPLVTGTALLVALTGYESLGVAATVPTWAWLAAGGVVLLAAGVLLERNDTSPVDAGRRLVDVVADNFG
jgi:signal transduction histidine kinase